MNADPDVMEYFPALLTPDESDAFVDRIEETFEARGHGLWAVETIDTGVFVGFIGLWPAEFAAPFTPATEIGWRLARPAWGRGYATEGAAAAVADGFDRVGLTEIVSFTATVNTRSRRVMEKLGMRRSATDDFDHPALPAGHVLAPHVLYRLGAPTRPSKVFVGCACVVADGHRRYLLVRETKAIASDRFALPGGKIEFDEELEAAAIREVREETGLDVEIVDLLGIFHIPRTSEGTYGVNFVYSASVVGGEITTSAEHPEIVWRSRARIDEMWDRGELRGQHAGEAIRLLEAGQSLDRAVVRVVGPAPKPRDHPVEKE